MRSNVRPRAVVLDRMKEQDVEQNENEGHTIDSDQIGELQEERNRSQRVAERAPGKGEIAIAAKSFGHDPGKRRGVEKVDREIRPGHHYGQNKDKEITGVNEDNRRVTGKDQPGE